MTVAYFLQDITFYLCENKSILIFILGDQLEALNISAYILMLTAHVLTDRKHLNHEILSLGENLRCTEC